MGVTLGPAHREHQYGHTLQIGIQLVLGFVMLGVGFYYLESCHNKAKTYLFYGGIVIVASNLFGCVMIGAKKLALADGKVTCMEHCGLCILRCVSLLLLLVNIVTMLWGTVVVMGSYCGWTFKTTDPNYCPYTPIVTAVVVLAVQWLACPFYVLCCCCSFFCNSITSTITEKVYSASFWLMMFGMCKACIKGGD